MEDALARVHREYREQCIKNGTYRPFTDAEYQRAVERWKQRVQEERLRPTKRRRKNPKGTAD